MRPWSRIISGEGQEFRDFVGVLFRELVALAEIFTQVAGADRLFAVGSHPDTPRRRQRDSASTELDRDVP